MRLHHYSIHTERSYCAWITRFITFHNMRSREDLNGGEAKIEAFLTHLAVHEQVSPSTQNQAMNALIFLYKKVLHQSLEQKINAVRAAARKNVPAVMSRKEVATVLSLMQGIQSTWPSNWGSRRTLFRSSPARRTPSNRCAARERSLTSRSAGNGRCSPRRAAS